MGIINKVLQTKSQEKQGGVDKRSVVMRSHFVLCALRLHRHQQQPHYHQSRNTKRNASDASFDTLQFQPMECPVRRLALVFSSCLRPCNILLGVLLRSETSQDLKMSNWKGTGSGREVVYMDVFGNWRMSLVGMEINNTSCSGIIDLFLKISMKDNMNPQSIPAT